MHPTSPKLLEDIQTACQLILRHVANRTLEDYERDPWLRAGVERSFEIVGEALHRLERRDPPTAAMIPDYRDMIDFRNLVAHGYDTINHARVWTYIHTHLPPLCERAGELLGEVDES